MLPSRSSKKWRASEKVAIVVNATSWSAFQETFRMNFFSQTFLDSQRQEFLGIMQAGRLVSSYLAKYERLAAMFPEIVSTKRARSQHFIRGLDPFIKRQLFTAPFITSAALRIEVGEEEIILEEQKGKTPAQFGQKRV